MFDRVVSLKNVSISLNLSCVRHTESTLNSWFWQKLIFHVQMSELILAEPHYLGTEFSIYAQHIHELFLQPCVRFIRESPVLFLCLPGINIFFLEYGHYPKQQPTQIDEIKACSTFESNQPVHLEINNPPPIAMICSVRLVRSEAIRRLLYNNNIVNRNSCSN